MVFLGDIFNDKTELATVPEIREIIHILQNLPNSIVLHSNHDQMVVKALEANRGSGNTPLYRAKGWDITQAYLNSLSRDASDQLKFWLSSHPFWVEVVTINDLHIAAAHAYPNYKAEKYRKGKFPTREQKTCIGIGTPHRWWSDEKYNNVLLNQDLTVIGHYGNINLRNRLVTIDLQGYQIPVWDPQYGRVLIF